MNNFPRQIFVLLFLISSTYTLCYTQSTASNELSIEVNRVYPYISISKAALSEANSLLDLNKDYKSSWVKSYLSVEISTTYNGNIITSISENDILSKEQKDMMNRADAGTAISILVRYLPDNTLTHNDPRKMNFTLNVDPESEATYPGGQQQLEKYLRENAIDKIPANSFTGYDLAVVKFTVNEKGEIMNAHLFGTEYRNNKDKNVDVLLLEAIRNMPSWKPAEYANGTKASQDFAFTVGNMENCMIHTLSIRRD